MNKITQKMYESLNLKYRSEMAEYEATILIYFNNSVGIGEHPQQLEEIDKLIEKMTNSKDKLEMLETIYVYNIKNDLNIISDDLKSIISDIKKEDLK